MIDVLFLLVCFTAGCLLLLRDDLRSFRGSTLLGFLLLTLGMTSPLALYPARMMLDAGAGTDAYIGVWNLWWTRTALEQGWNPYETRMIFAPHGTSLALHSYSFLYGLASLPLQYLLGAVAPALSPREQLFVVYNLLLVVSFTLSGYFTYRLAMEETGNRAAAVIAGLVFAYGNFRFANTVRSHVMPGELVVLAAWAWVRLLKVPSARRLVLWAGAMILLVYGSLELAAYTTVLILILGIGAVRNVRFPALWRLVPAVAAACAGSVLLLLPLITALIRRLSEGGAGFPSGMALFFSADVLDFVLPNPRHPIWGEPFRRLTGVFHLGDDGFGLSIGLTAVVLFTLSAGIMLRRRVDRRWFWAAIVLLVLSLGPGLHIAGYVVPLLPLPYDLVSRLLPFLGMSHTPIRYMAVASLCISMTIACGWALRSRLSGMRRLEIALPVLILLESLAAPMAMVEVPAPTLQSAIAERAGDAPGEYALVHIPGLDHRTELLYQTTHRQALVADVRNAVPLRSERGPHPFDSPAWRALTRGIGDAAWWATIPETRHEEVRAAMHEMLSDLRVRWIVLARSQPRLLPGGRGFDVHHALTEAEFELFRDRLRWLGLEVVKETEDAALFENLP